MNITSDTESEKMVLGALLLDGSLYHIVNGMLCPADFTDKMHQEIFACIEDLFKKHGCFNIPMLIDELSISGHPLYTLVENCISTKNIKSHADIIRERSVQRQLSGIAKEIAEAL